MNFPNPEYDAALTQTVRIAETLRAQDIDAQIVRNQLDEPLAVVARNILDPRTILGSVRLHQLKQQVDAFQATDEESEAHYRVRETFPVAGESESLVLPASFLQVIDLAVQAAMDTPDIFATELESYPIVSRKADDRGWLNLNTHIDYSTHLEDEIAAKPISGLNIHVTRSGSCAAMFGLVRSFADVQRIGAISDKDSLAKELGAPFSRPVELGTGDAVIFQAGPHKKLGRLPVAHEFFTTGQETRYSELYIPTGYELAAAVLPLRQQIARDFQLTHLGYAA